MDSTLASSLGTQTEKLSTGDSIVLLEAKLKQQLKPWQIENGKAQFSNFLYRIFDRENSVVGLRGTYSGLWEKFQEINQIDPELAEHIRLNFILKSNVTTNSP